MKKIDKRHLTRGWGEWGVLKEMKMLYIDGMLERSNVGGNVQGKD